jgi:hypothetical protein
MAAAHNRNGHDATVAITTADEMRKPVETMRMAAATISNPMIR